MNLLTIIVALASLVLVLDLNAQEAQFIRRGGTYVFVQGPVKEVRKAEDARVFWKRLLRAVRPWFTSSKGANISYGHILDQHVFELEGTYGVGIQAKVEF